MRYLSLFTGAGGGDLAMQHLLGFTCVGYVENEKYCQEIIKQRIADGVLDAAPGYGDIRRFIADGYAGAYQGLVDLVTAGFPCQPHSVAGKRLHEKDERNLWPETARTIELVNPRCVLFENVPGIKPYLPVVIRDLRQLGYTVKRPAIVAAAALGAGHIRKRVWIFADGTQAGLQDDQRSGQATDSAPRREPGDDNREKIPSDNEGVNPSCRPAKGKPPRGFTGCSWWAAEPGVDRVVYGLAHGHDRLAALGNGQVPCVAARAWEILTNQEEDQCPTS